MPKTTTYSEDSSPSARPLRPSKTVARAARRLRDRIVLAAVAVVLSSSAAGLAAAALLDPPVRAATGSDPTVNCLLPGSSAQEAEAVAQTLDEGMAPSPLQESDTFSAAVLREERTKQAQHAARMAARAHPAAAPAGG